MNLLTSSEISSIFNDSYLYEKNSFHVLEKADYTYNEARPRESFIKEALFLKNSFKAGHTLIVKNLENFNESIRLKAAKLGRVVDVHMYLVPHGGLDSFDFHTDDKDVYIHMVYGKKKFILKEIDGEKEYLLSDGDELFIKKGVVHKALPLSGSCLLSFGVDTSVSYQIPGGIEEKDLI